jgi:hypothetical protein
VVLVGLLGLVAIGSAGHSKVDIGERRPYYAFADTVGSLLLVVLALGVVAGVWMVIAGRDYLVAQRLAKKKRWSRSLLAFGILALVLLLPFARGLRPAHPSRREPRLAQPTASVGGGTRTTAAAYKPRFATTPVLIVLGLAGGAVVAAYVAYRPRRREPGTKGEEASSALTLADVLGDTLDDLRAEPDPRRAVIAAYARLESTLGAFGLPRRAAEAPDEYLHRIFVDLGVHSGFARELTQLFAQAKFSQHTVDRAMKEKAIQLLVTIRTGLRDADVRAAHQALIRTTRPRTAS